MTADNETSLNLRQVAVLGSSADLATEVELMLAGRAGKAIAERRLVLATAGDDGTMGAAAKAAKSVGGTTVAILPRGKTLVSDWMFDAVVNTGLSWVQFSDILLKSCRGALIIGGGAGTLGELSLLYLNSIPGAFVGSQSTLAQAFGGRHLDSRRLSVLPCFDEVEPALDHVLAASAPEGPSSFERLIQNGREIHDSCYPYGTKGDYLASASLYSLAAAQPTIRGSRAQWKHAAALYLDALGDHEYYHTRNYFQAAGDYSQAIKLLTEVIESGEQVDTDVQSFRDYLRALTVESIGLAFDALGESALAAHLCHEAARLYQAAIARSSQTEHAYLRHSSLGLEAFAAYLEAECALKDNQLLNAETLSERARALCDASAQEHRLWQQSGFSDSYTEFVGKLDRLRAEIQSALGARHNASQNS